MDLRAVNLNLLAAFGALMEEKNVTRAAGRMGVTQSAMSSSLAQLRELFDDPLFHRAAHGIVPTPRAEALFSPVSEGLNAFRKALSPPRFDPHTSDRTFVLAASDQAELVVLPGLLRALARVAPRVKV